MDELFAWLSDNWFSIGLLGSLLTFIIKFIRKADKYDLTMTELSSQMVELKNVQEQLQDKLSTFYSDNTQLKENVALLRHDIDQVKTDISNSIEFQSKLKQSQSETISHLEDILVRVNGYDEMFDQQTEYNKLVIKGLKASLNGLVELGTNGPTHEALKEYELFVDSKLFK